MPNRRLLSCTSSALMLMLNAPTAHSQSPLPETVQKLLVDKKYAEAYPLLKREADKGSQAALFMLGKD